MLTSVRSLPQLSENFIRPAWRRLQPALSCLLITPSALQNLFHKTHVRKFALDIRWGEPELKRALAGPLLERFIGVIYVRLALCLTPGLIRPNAIAS